MSRISHYFWPKIQNSAVGVHVLLNVRYLFAIFTSHFIQFIFTSISFRLEQFQYNTLSFSGSRRFAENRLRSTFYGLNFFFFFLCVPSQEQRIPRNPVTKSRKRPLELPTTGTARPTPEPRLVSVPPLEAELTPQPRTEKPETR